MEERSRDCAVLLLSGMIQEQWRWLRRGGGGDAVANWLGSSAFFDAGRAAFFHGAVWLRREFVKTESGRSEFTWRSDETQGGS